MLRRDVNICVPALHRPSGLGARWAQQYRLPVEQRLLQRLVRPLRGGGSEAKHSLVLQRAKISLILVVAVLLDLRNMLQTGRAKASEGKCEEQEHGHSLDQSPTPTSLEVRGHLYVGFEC